MDNYEAYVASFMKEKGPLITEMEQYAEEHMFQSWTVKASIYLSVYYAFKIREHILEIGSAIGYSAIRIAEALPEASIMTIERDNGRYLKAVDYIERSGLTNAFP